MLYHHIANLNFIEQCIASRDAHQVVNAQLFQLQHNRAQVGAQNLWVGLLLQIFSKRSFCVQPEALSWLRAPSSTCPLMSACLQKQRPFIFKAAILHSATFCEAGL